MEMIQKPSDYKGYQKALFTPILILLSLYRKFMQIRSEKFNNIYLAISTALACDTEIAQCQELSTAAPSTVYVSSRGYIGFSTGSNSLSGSETSLRLRFRACSSDGLLLYAEDSSNLEYFALGLFRGQLLVESRNVTGTITDVRVIINIIVSNV